MESEHRNESAATVATRPRLAIYHANMRGTGSAITMEVHPAHGAKSGCIMMSIACQSAAGGEDVPLAERNRFDWEGKITVKLDYLDLCKILQVLRGECEAIEDGRGLYHATSKAVTRIRFRHMLEPTEGYSIDVSRTPRDGGKDSRACFLMSRAEATGVSDAVSGSMAVICFGIPVVLPHDTAAYEAAERRFRDGRAA